MKAENKKTERAKRLIKAVLVLGIAIFMYIMMMFAIPFAFNRMWIGIFILIIPWIIGLLFIKVRSIRKRALKTVLLICLLLVTLGIICVMNIEHETGISWCEKCYVSRSWDNIYLYWYPIIKRESLSYHGTPQLKLTQQKCSHPPGCQAGCGRSSSLFYTELGHSSAPIGFSWARWCEQYGCLEAVAYLEHIRDYQYSNAEDKKRYEDEWAWFMQQATGHDFGITFDDDSCQPKVTDGTVEKILDWWEADGKKLYGSQPE